MPATCPTKTATMIEGAGVSRLHQTLPALQPEQRVVCPGSQLCSVIGAFTRVGPFRGCPDAMPCQIEDYAVIGNCESAAMVGCNGSIDWLAVPRFDSAACFAALLGGPENGRWLIAPLEESYTSRRYRPGTLVLETHFENAAGASILTDAMGRRDGCCDLVRIIRGARGRMRLRMELIIRSNMAPSSLGCAGSMMVG